MNCRWTHVNAPIVFFSLIDEEARSMRGRSTTDPAVNYLSYEQIQVFMDDLVQKYPDRVYKTSYGKSHAGRDLIEVKISEDLSDSQKPIVYVEATTHAREWLSLSTALNLIKTLAEADPSTEPMLKYEWRIWPLHNPDGYEYSRMRKSSSSYECSDTYCGTKAFSTNETKIFSSAIEDVLGNNREVSAFFSMHCYSQFMLVPYAYTNRKPDDINNLMCVADKMMEALTAVNDKYFIIGAPPDILYAASGGAYDWAKVKAGINYSYTYELRPRQGDSGGFIQPASEIRPTADETIASLRAFADIDNLAKPC